MYEKPYLRDASSFYGDTDLRNQYHLAGDANLRAFGNQGFVGVENVFTTTFEGYLTKSLLGVKFELAAFLDAGTLSGSKFTVGDYGFSTSLVDEYPEGSETTAYYNSDDPNQAVLIKGFSGLLPVIIMIFGIMSLGFAAIVIFLMVWKILYHIQPKQNRQKAEKQYEDDIDDEREEREQRLKLRIARKTESFQGQSKTLSVQIDGEKGVIEVRTVMDIFESQLFDFRSVGILYLDNSHKMGRNLEFRYTSDEGDELEIREFLGEELIREQLINMDIDPTDAIDFISDALKSATPDTDEWWN
jgi:hypothetical protein